MMAAATALQSELPEQLPASAPQHPNNACLLSGLAAQLVSQVCATLLQPDLGDSTTGSSMYMLDETLWTLCMVHGAGWDTGGPSSRASTLCGCSSSLTTWARCVLGPACMGSECWLKVVTGKSRRPAFLLHICQLNHSISISIRWLIANESSMSLRSLWLLADLADLPARGLSTPHTPQSLHLAVLASGHPLLTAASAVGRVDHATGSYQAADH